MTILQHAEAGAADFEEAYGHDVTGGGLAPNAGLPAPTLDDDPKTDVYPAAPVDMPDRAQITEAPDTKRPRTRIRKHPRKRTSSHLAVFVFAANEPARFECRLDRRKFKRGRTRTRLRVKTGHQVLRVRAVDRAGNVDKTPARRAWTVVRRAPKR